MSTTPELQDNDLDGFDPYLYMGREEEATYHFLNIPGYDGNPLIEALGPFLTQQEVARRLIYLPDVRPTDRLRPIRERYDLIWEAAEFYKPTSHVLQLEEKLSRLVRAGYKARNPLDPWHQRRVHGRVDALSASGVSGLTVPDLGRGGWAPRAPLDAGPSAYGAQRWRRPQVTALTVLGLSGVGKTSAVMQILNLYPQRIRHTLYPGPGYRGRWDGEAGGRPFTQTQLVWLLLQCPHNRSTNSLCKSFFAAVDRLMGTNYSRIFRHGKGTNRSMLVLEMARVALNHHLGALVIDEVQALSVAKSQGHSEMLEFFTELRNTIGIPVILIGTPRAAPILTDELHGARRGESVGSFRWLNMQEDAEWEEFIRTLWAYQYIASPCELTDKLSHALYHESAGITDYAVKLFFLAQIRAMEVAAAGGRSERLTPAIISSVAKDSIPLGRPALALLRTVRPSTTFKTLAGIPEIAQLKHEAAMEAAIERINEIEGLNGGRERPAAGVEGHAPATGPSRTGTPPVTGGDGTEDPSGDALLDPRRSRRAADAPTAPHDSIMAIVAAAKERAVVPYQALLDAGLICRLQDELAAHAAPTEGVA